MSETFLFRSTAFRWTTALLNDKGVVSTVCSEECASTLGLDEQERHRSAEPGRQH
jgi:hypothetical protein